MLDVLKSVDKEEDEEVELDCNEDDVVESGEVLEMCDNLVDEVILDCNDDNVEVLDESEDLVDCRVAEAVVTSVSPESVRKIVDVTVPVDVPDEVGGDFVVVVYWSGVGAPLDSVEVENSPDEPLPVVLRYKSLIHLIYNILPIKTRFHYYGYKKSCLKRNVNSLRTKTNKNSKKERLCNILSISQYLNTCIYLLHFLTNVDFSRMLIKLNILNILFVLFCFVLFSCYSNQSMSDYSWEVYIVHSVVPTCMRISLIYDLPIV